MDWAEFVEEELRVRGWLVLKLEVEVEWKGGGWSEEEDSKSPKHCVRET